MSPNIPLSAQPIFGPAVSPDGRWGGVPWMHGVTHPEPLQGLRAGHVTTFPYAPGNAVLAVTDSDNDLDGPGGSKKVDPCWEPGTSLHRPGGASCDSRAFPGVVISPALERFGIRLGDFCLVAWNGAVRSAQVYDIGPTRKAGENSLFLNRGLGLVPPAWSDRHAALVGHDAQDVCTLIFAGSGPGHALGPDEIVAGAHACWLSFTARQGEAAAGGSGPRNTAPAQASAATGSRAASGSAGLAALLVLAGLTLGCTATRESAYFPESLTATTTLGRDDHGGWDRETVGLNLTWRLKPLRVAPVPVAAPASAPAATPFPPAR